MSHPLYNPAHNDDDAPLELADSSEGSSTQPVPTNSGSSSKDSRADSSVLKSDESSSEDSRGKSTGLDTMLGRVFVERGYITGEELDACRAIQEQAGKSSDPRTLSDVMIENEFLTKRQLDRIRNEVEAEKSTEQIPGYKIIRKLGSGAMATVFLARQLSLDRLVAIKVLPSKFSSNEKFIERFYKEGRAAAQLNHRNIVSAYDVGQAGDHHYFVMEYVDGLTIYEEMVKKKRIKEDEAIRIVRQVAEALVHAHAKGFIHRDIKPKNILLSTSNTVKLADLGLARAVSDKEAAQAEAGRAYGTPYYISPEQIRGKVDIGPPADIYGLGATFYHMVTGKVPFEGKNPSSVMHKHLKSKLVPPDHLNTRLSPGTAQVIEMMLAKSRRSRYQNVHDLIVDLDKIAAGDPPHFAHSSQDLTAIALKIEEEAKGATIAVHKKVQGEQKKLSEHPAFLLVAIAAIFSILLNIILIMILVSGSGQSDTERNSSSPPSNIGNGTDAQSMSLLGRWESVKLSGESFKTTSTSRVVYFFEPGGAGKYWVTSTDGKQTAYDIMFEQKPNILTITIGTQKREYSYEQAGNMLLLYRENGAIKMELRRMDS